MQVVHRAWAVLCQYQNFADRRYEQRYHVIASVTLGHVEEDVRYTSHTLYRTAHTRYTTTHDSRGQPTASLSRVRGR